MINLTKDEFSEVVATSISEFVNAVEDDALVPVLVTLCAMIGARAETKTEHKEKLQREAQMLYNYDETYHAGDWTISISRNENLSNVRLIVEWKGQTRLNAVVSSIHAAYDYAFNSLVK